MKDQESSLVISRRSALVWCAVGLWPGWWVSCNVCYLSFPVLLHDYLVWYDAKEGMGGWEWVVWLHMERFWL